MPHTYCRKILQKIIAQLSHSIGFDSCQISALDVLVDVLERFLERAGRMSTRYSEQCMNTEVHINDVLQCFKQECFSTNELVEYFQQMEQVKYPHQLPKFPASKSSNLQFPTEPHENPDLEPHLPSMKFSTPPLEAICNSTNTDLNVSQTGSNSGDYSIIRKQPEDSEDDSFIETDDTRPEDIPIVQGTAASSLCDAPGSAMDPLKDCDNLTENEEKRASADPVWLQQYTAKIESKDRGHVAGTSHSVEASVSSENPRSPSRNFWDQPKSSRSKFSKDGSGKYGNRRIQKTEEKSYTSRIEEVERLLQDPIVEPLSRKTTETFSASHQSPRTPESPMDIDTNDNQVDSVIDAVINRASKDAKEAELMKFSHLINNSSSSDEEINPKLNSIPPARVVEDDFYSIQPPLTPSPALSTSSIMIDEDEEDGYSIKKHFTPEDPEEASLPESNEMFHENENEDYDDYMLSDTSVKAPVRTRTPTPEPVVETFEKAKKKIKHKSSSKRRKQTELGEGSKSIEKLVLKKFKNEAKSVNMHKEERLPVPKLSAAVDIPVNKKKDKKEKKKKKDKDRESKKKSHKEDSLPAIPKLTFKMNQPRSSVVSHKPQESKYYSDVAEIKPEKTKEPKHAESSSKRLKLSSKSITTEEVKPKKADIKPKPKPVEATSKVTTQTIHVAPTAGIVFDEHGNKIWICPGCGKPDDGSPMIGCDDCDAWYHWPCVNLVKEPPEDEKWFCPNCVKAHKNKKKSSKRKRQR